MKARRQQITRIACVIAGIILLYAPVNSSVAGGDADGATLTGTWYLTLGLGVPALATLHRDGTFTSSDGTDFGGPPFSFRNSAIRGVWARTGARTFEAIGINLSADPITGELLHITKSIISLQFGDDFDQVEGQVVLQEVFLCDTPFDCPDPLTAEPDTTSEGVPFRGRRLRLERQPFHHDDD